MFVYLNRYRTEALPLYLKLYELLKKKNYFVITTNVDHQFQKAGFAKERIFYTQGDYGLFQCSVPCHLKTYDNEQIIKKMIANQKDHRISEELLPKCPVCGKPMSMNLRSDDTFVEDEGWKKAAERYVSFLQKNKDRKILFLELGVGWNTPGISKIPFMKMTEEMPLAHYVCINTEKMECFEEIESRSIFFQSDLKELIEQVAEEYEES